MLTDTAKRSFQVEEIRKDFPILSRKVNGRQLIYFDNGATAQKPKAVIECIANYYSQDNSNIHRGVHHLSQIGTLAYENARIKLKEYFNANCAEEIIFTKGTTDSINLLASTFGQRNIKAGDEIMISAMEHHSNIVPWQMLCEETGAQLKVAPINEKGELLMDEFEKLLTEKTKLVSIAHVSNALGTVNLVQEIIKLAHKKGAKVLIDGAQAVPHGRIDFQDLDCDFYAASAHKMFGPTGVGFLYGKKELLEAMPPYQGGGDMIKKVSFEKTTYNDLPYKLEAGTPNISGVIAFGAAVEYLEKLDWEAINEYEEELLKYCQQQLLEIPQLRLIGDAASKESLVSFVVKGIHPYDIGVILDKLGIAVRTGHHCTQPLMDFYGIPGTVRASFAMYNTKKEIDALIEATKRAIKMLS